MNTYAAAGEADQTSPGTLHAIDGTQTRWIALFVG
jgi:hypothetical protein